MSDTVNGMYSQMAKLVLYTKYTFSPNLSV